MIPSYKRPNAPLLQKILTEKGFPVYIFVRKEEHAEYSSIYSGRAKVVALPSNTTNVSKTRQNIVKYCVMNKIPRIFMFDDDITEFDFCRPNPENTCMKSQSTLTGTPASYKELLQNWEKIILQEKPVISSAAYRRFGWSNHKMYNSGKRFIPFRQHIQCVSLDIKQLYQAGINYPDEIAHGEDLVIQLEAMRKRMKVMMLLGIWYNCPEVGTNYGGCNVDEIAYDRAMRGYKQFCKMYGEEVPGIDLKFTQTSKQPSLKFNWNYWRKYYEKGGVEWRLDGRVK